MAEILQAEQDYNDNIANVKARIESENKMMHIEEQMLIGEAFKAGHGGGGTNTNTH